MASYYSNNIVTYSHLVAWLIAISYITNLRSLVIIINAQLIVQCLHFSQFVGSFTPKSFLKFIICTSTRSKYSVNRLCGLEITFTGYRYSYKGQLEIVQWNLAQLATSFIAAGLIDKESAQSAINAYADQVVVSYDLGLAKKLGLLKPNDDVVRTQHCCLALRLFVRWRHAVWVWVWSKHPVIVSRIASFKAEISVTSPPKKMYFHYLKKHFLDQSIQKNISFNFEKRSTGVHSDSLPPIALSSSFVACSARNFPTHPELLFAFGYF